ncbi:MAG: hypothetical protein WED00_09030 [Aquisalimonadaceae bacterium]
MVRERQDDSDANVLEQGNIYFMYRPRVQQDGADDPSDVQRFYMALKPKGKSNYRLMVIGRKRLPDVREHERVWGFVDMVTDNPKEIEQELQEHAYETKTRGKRTVPAARPAGEGTYAIAQTDKQMHLVYALELPKRPGEVQKDLKIAPEASFALSVKNPEKGQPKDAGLRSKEKPDLPEEKQEEFRNRRFDSEQPELLDYEGIEFVLVGARSNPEEQYGLDLEPEQENPRTANIIKDLRMTKSHHPVEPLLKGEWR